MTAPKEKPVPEQKTPEPTVFNADYGLHLDDLGVQFAWDESAPEKVSNTGQQGGVGSRVYRYETTDPKVVDALRGMVGGEYGVREVK